MRLNFRNWQSRVLGYAMCATLLGSLAYSATPNAPQIVSDQKSKIKGTIVWREPAAIRKIGDLSGVGRIPSVKDNA